MRFLAYLVLLASLAIAGVGAYFSIIGLKLLFVGGGLSIIIMGTALEVGKLITATFLKQKWNDISWWMRTYLVAATLALVCITSIGIYGFLSAGYNATSVAVQGYERQIELNTLKIGELEKETSTLKQDVYNEPEIISLNDNRKSYLEQRNQLVATRNAQIEKIRSGAGVNKDASGDIASAKQALDTAKAALDSDATKEIEQIKLYNDRLGILDQEVKKWLDEGRGSIFRKGGLDKARETKELQQKERDDIDAQIKKSQDRIDRLREQYAAQVKEYNDRISAIESRVKAERADVDNNIKTLEQANAQTLAEISSYNKETDTKIAELNLHKTEMADRNKKKISDNQTAMQLLHEQNDKIRETIVHTDVGTFKFIAKSLNIPLDRAVNYFIWMIMGVFDPLAVCLILAFNVMLGKKPSPAPTPASVISSPGPTTTITPTPLPTPPPSIEFTPSPTESPEPSKIEAPSSVQPTVVSGELIPPCTKHAGHAFADIK